MTLLTGTTLKSQILLRGTLHTETTESRSLQLRLTIVVEDLEAFVSGVQGQGDVTGNVTVDGKQQMELAPGAKVAILVPSDSPGSREIKFSLPLQDHSGQETLLQATARMQPGVLGTVDDDLREFELVWKQRDTDTLLGRGTAQVPVNSVLKLITSTRIEGGSSPWAQVAGRSALLSYFVGTISRSTLSPIDPLYETGYENLVISGQLRDTSGSTRPFFFVSGAHDMGFPWGDGETFWDLLLIIEDDDGGWCRYAASSRWLEGMRTNVDAGSYRYDGPLYRLPADQTDVYFSQLNGEGQSELVPLMTGSIELSFTVNKHDDIPFPFPVIDKLLQEADTELIQMIRTWAPEDRPFGIHIRPSTVSSISGLIELDDGDGGERWIVDESQSFGEAEHSTFKNVREPTLLYGYICAIDRERQSHRVQIHSGALRDERQNWASDQVDRGVGDLLERTASVDIHTTPSGTTVKRLSFPAPETSWRHVVDEIFHGTRKSSTHERETLFTKLAPPVLVLHLDHYPTAEFQRRIIWVKDPAGRTLLALEEAMSTMRLGAENSEEKAHVAISHGDDKFQVLDEALDHGHFDEVIDRKIAQCQAPVDQLLVAVKPNFMFSYSKYDPTSFVDPELFAHFIRRLRSKGLRNIKLVEARSTYGTFFDKRSVAEMAEYLGYDGEPGGEHLYDVVDLTEEAEGSTYFGPHLGCSPVPPTWRDADLRISFAKNKTHPYAFYTLTLKNVYGTLPYEDKFKEYHCDRDIYHTTMEWLTRFPVDYGLIDAYVSADGPFGVFADPSPNHTKTVIAGTDIVAVAWVGASKMGLHPKVSKFMRLAIEQFGKPRIELWGDSTIYRPWLNVPTALTVFTNEGLDAYHPTGNLIYAAGTQMDTEHFTFQNNALYMKMLRRLTLPIRKAMFVRTGEKPTWANRMLSDLFTRMGG